MNQQPKTILKSTVQSLSNSIYTTINGVLVSMSAAREYDRK